MRIRAKFVLVHPCAVFKIGASAFRDCRSMKLMMVEAKRSPPIHQRSLLIGAGFLISTCAGLDSITGQSNSRVENQANQASGIARHHITSGVAGSLAAVLLNFRL